MPGVDEKLAAPLKKIGILGAGLMGALESRTEDVGCRTAELGEDVDRRLGEKGVEFVGLSP